jgi:predicted RNA binding protein YcfA (HicA-like mRNA interferase family)
MPKTKVIGTREMHKILKKNGFWLERTSASHERWTNGPLNITVIANTAAFKIKTLRSMFRQAGLPWPPE